MIRLVYSASQAKTRTLDDEAMAWVVKLTAGDSAPEDHDAFRQWREQSPEHLAALKRARAIWQQLGSALPQIEARRDRGRRYRRLSARVVPIAASLLLALYAGDHYWTIGRFDHVTAVGERRSVALSDGSTVMMSGDTAMNVISAGGVRRIDLSRGEIFVRVRHDAIRPFVVHAGEAHFRDVGTAFDVARQGDGARLVVSEGIVEASRDDRRLLVTKNQGVSAVGALGTLQYADAATEAAWVGGRLVLKNRTLPQIVDTLAPYYRSRIVLLGSASGGQAFDATIDLDHIDEWLTALEQMQHIRATRIARYVFLH